MIGRKGLNGCGDPAEAGPAVYKANIMPTQSSELSRSIRVPLEMPVLCHCAAGTVQAMTQEVGRHGLWVRSPPELAADSLDRVELALLGESDWLTLAVAAEGAEGAEGAGTSRALALRITEPDADKRQRWDLFYEHLLTAGPSGLAEAPAGRLVSTAGVLSPALSGQLEALGFTVATARDNLHVLALLQPDTAQVVLAELHAPPLGGLELCHLIRRQRSFARTAVILVTANSTAGDFLSGLHAGASYVIARPFSVEYCVSRVLAAASQLDSGGPGGTGPEDGAERAATRGVSATSGATLSFLPHASGLPQAIGRATDWLSDLYFFAKLAARNQLRR